MRRSQAMPGATVCAAMIGATLMLSAAANAESVIPVAGVKLDLDGATLTRYSGDVEEAELPQLIQGIRQDVSKARASAASRGHKLVFKVFWHRYSYRNRTTAVEGNELDAEQVAQSLANGIQPGTSAEVFAPPAKQLSENTKDAIAALHAAEQKSMARTKIIFTVIRVTGNTAAEVYALYTHHVPPVVIAESAAFVALMCTLSGYFGKEIGNWISFGKLKDLSPRELEALEAEVEKLSSRGKINLRTYRYLKFFGIETVFGGAINGFFEFVTKVWRYTGVHATIPGVGIAAALATIGQQTADGAVYGAYQPWAAKRGYSAKTINFNTLLMSTGISYLSVIGMLFSTGQYKIMGTVMLGVLAVSGFALEQFLKPSPTVSSFCNWAFSPIKKLMSGKKAEENLEEPVTLTAQTMAEAHQAAQFKRFTSPNEAGPAFQVNSETNQYVPLNDAARELLRKRESGQNGESGAFLWSPTPALIQAA